MMMIKCRAIWLYLCNIRNSKTDTSQESQFLICPDWSEPVTTLVATKVPRYQGKVQHCIAICQFTG